MPEKPVPRSAVARQCRSGHLVLVEVQAVEAVLAVQRCFEEDVQQCLDACPRSLRSKGLKPTWLRTMLMMLTMLMMMLVMMTMMYHDYDKTMSK